MFCFLFVIKCIYTFLQLDGQKQVTDFGHRDIQAVKDAAQPCHESGAVAFEVLQPKFALHCKAFSKYTTIIKDKTVKLLTGHKELQTRLMTLPNMNFWSMVVLYL